MEYYRLTIPIPKQPWRWIRFRISTILLLVAILALILAWRRDHQQLAEQLYQIQNPVTGWSVHQVTGPPNTSGPGDISTAWASATQDDQEEWLQLEYEESVIPTAILVHETYNPGAVFKVTHVPRWGLEKVLWEGTDPTPAGAGGGVSRLPVTSGIRTSRIKVYLNSSAVPGWNEIDAVGLEYGDKEVIWAERATASSSYGGGAATSFSAYSSPLE
jgi:hypothetical protein